MMGEALRQILQWSLSLRELKLLVEMLTEQWCQLIVLAQMPIQFLELGLGFFQCLAFVWLAHEFPPHQFDAE